MRWYYHDGSKQFGPVDQGEVVRLIGSGIVRASTQVWKEGTPSWVSAVSTELKEHLQPEPPPIILSPPPMTSTASENRQMVLPRNPPRSIGWMTFCGFLWAGLGQLILGQSAKGVVLMVADILLLPIPGGIIFSLILSIISAIDANKVAKRLGSGKPVDPWSFFPS
jgi:TM2 domain-containing membrane protein YozV